MDKKELFSRSSQIDVSVFMRNHVEPQLHSKFIGAFHRWDESLKRVSFRQWSSFSEGLCWMMLSEAKE